LKVYVDFIKTHADVRARCIFYLKYEQTIVKKVYFEEKLKIHRVVPIHNFG